MVSVTGMTVAEINRQLDEMVVSVEIVDGSLIYTRRSGEEVDGGALVDSGVVAEASYPVGSIYVSTVPANPGDPGMLGFGTWSRFGNGRALVGVDETQTEFNAAGVTGGSKEHTLTAAQMPAHSHVMTHDHGVSVGSAGNHAHDIAIRYAGNFSENENGDAITGVGGANHGSVTGGGTDTGSTASAGSHTHSVDITPFTGSTQSSGGVSGVTQPHNNLQPYISVYIWRRTA